MVNFTRYIPKLFQPRLNETERRDALPRVANYFVVVARQSLSLPKGGEIARRAES